MGIRLTIIALKACTRILLTLPKKGRKKLPKRAQSLILQPLQLHICWSMDFISDCLMDGRKFRTLHMIDDYIRECLSVEVGLSIPIKKVIRTLESIKEYRSTFIQVTTTLNASRTIVNE
jgi:putative transposase